MAVADWQANENIVAGDYGLEPERIGFGDRSVGSEVRFTLPTFFVKKTLDIETTSPFVSGRASKLTSSRDDSPDSRHVRRSKARAQQ